MDACLNAAELLLSRTSPTRTALVCGTQSMCWGELRLATARAAGAWQDCGVAPGDAVLLRLPPGIEASVALLGAIWAGAVAVPLPRALPQEEWAMWAADVGCRFILDESREGYGAAWRDHVLTRTEWQIAWRESQAAPAVARPAEAAACRWNVTAARPRTVTHAFAVTGAAAPAKAGGAHTGTVLGLLRALRRGATVVLPSQQPVRPTLRRRAAAALHWAAP
jgi:acyl-CoA synthetase (AMP-forming)/AMP-acid ligase II